MSLQVSIRKSGDVTILDLRGRATIGVNSELLSSRIKHLLDNGERKLLLNLAELSQVDSTGVNVIVRTYFSLRRQGGDLRLLRPSGRVLEVFKILHVLEIVPSFDDETEVLASFRPQALNVP